jgi:hypothetical protein
MVAPDFCDKDHPGRYIIWRNTPTHSSWLNRVEVEVQFQALRHFALDATPSTTNSARS